MTFWIKNILCIFLEVNGVNGYRYARCVLKSSDDGDLERAKNIIIEFALDYKKGKIWPQHATAKKLRKKKEKLYMDKHQPDISVMVTLSKSINQKTTIF